MQCIQFQCYSLQVSTLFSSTESKSLLFTTNIIWINSDQISCYFFQLICSPFSPIFSLCAKTKLGLLYWENGIRQEIILFNSHQPTSSPAIFFLSLFFFFFCSSDSIYISQDVITRSKTTTRDKDIRNLLKRLGLKKLVDLVEKTVQAYFLCQMIRLKSLQIQTRWAVRKESFMWTEQDKESKQG